MEKPHSLRRGDTIGIIAPASGIKDKTRLLDGISVLTDLGYNIIAGKSCYEKHGYLAGSDFIRAQDFNTFFSNSKINAIICLRGGYGSARILGKIDYDIVSKNPKIFVGYSDITALHFALYKKCNLVTFHGPMVSSDIADRDIFTINNLIECLEGRIKTKNYILNPIKPGNIKGSIFGGNLSLIYSLLSSKYNINWHNKILFIEDVDEEPYAIDRMLHTLKLSGVLDKVSGVVLGQFTDCISKYEDSLSVDELFNEFFHDFNVPVYSGLPAGHDMHKITIPMGIKCEINDNILNFTEEGVN